MHDVRIAKLHRTRTWLVQKQVESIFKATTLQEVPLASYCASMMSSAWQAIDLSTAATAQLSGLKIFRSVETSLTVPAGP